MYRVGDGTRQKIRDFGSLKPIFMAFGHVFPKKVGWHLLERIDAIGHGDGASAHSLIKMTGGAEALN